MFKHGKYLYLKTQSDSAEDVRSLIISLFI